MTFPTVTERNGVTMTRPMFEFMTTIADGEWHDLPKVNQRTIKALWLRDWIAKSVSIASGRTEYKLTSRGQEALYAFTHSQYRFDNLCPRCQQRERHITRNGTVSPYCAECNRAVALRSYHKNNPRQAGKLCQCGRPRYVMPNGHVASYCRECNNQRIRSHRPLWTKRRIDQMKNGDVPLCNQCGKEPCHFTENTAYTRCFRCLKVQREQSRIRRIARKFKEKNSHA